MSFVPLSQLFAHNRATAHPIALRNGQIVTFAQLQNDAARLAAQWRNIRRAVLACTDGYTFVAALCGLLHIGADIVFPANYLPATLQACGVDADLMIDDAALDACAMSDARECDVFDPQHSKLFFYTSGSTGAPKMIEKNLAMFEVEAAALQSLWGAKLGQGPVFSTAAHQHVYGMTFKLLWPLMRGAPFVAQTYALWENLLTDLGADAVIISSPAHLERLSGISSLMQNPQAIFSAGAPLSLAASAQAQQIFGCRVTEIFGSTETGACATRMQHVGDEAWRLLPGLAMRVEDNGRLSLQSPFAGPDWVMTADLVTPANGGFAFQGRADRIVKIEGKRVSLTEVETALQYLPEVQSVATLMVDDPALLGALVVPTAVGQDLLHEMGAFRFGRHLRAQLGATLEAAALPRRWRFHTQMPTQMLGKRRDTDLRALFDAEATS